MRRKQPRRWPITGRASGCSFNRRYLRQVPLGFTAKAKERGSIAWHHQRLVAERIAAANVHGHLEPVHLVVPVGGALAQDLDASEVVQALAGGAQEGLVEPRLWTHRNGHCSSPNRLGCMTGLANGDRLLRVGSSPSPSAGSPVRAVRSVRQLSSVRGHVFSSRPSVADRDDRWRA